MEKARSYWTATVGRRRFGEMPFLAAQIPSIAVIRSSSFDESWEERAFAKDSAGHLAGSCVWPPRSYSCSFCRREFRSAQALGGHMNVHRKDRAMLKQCSSPGAAAGDQPHECISHLMISPARELQYGAGSTTINPNPNSASSLPHGVSAGVPSLEHWSLQSSTTSCIYSPSIVRENVKHYPIVSTAALAPTATLQLFALPEESDLNKTTKSLQQYHLGTMRKAEFQTVGDQDEEDDEIKRTCNKRRRIESEERQDDQKEELVEEYELDLELRLGDIYQV